MSNASEEKPMDVVADVGGQGQKPKSGKTDAKGKKGMATTDVMLARYEASLRKGLRSPSSISFDDFLAKDSPEKGKPNHNIDRSG